MAGIILFLLYFLIIPIIYVIISKRFSYKRFAQRHTYLGIDVVVNGDLGFAMARKPTADNSSGKSESTIAQVIWLQIQTGT